MKYNLDEVFEIAEQIERNGAAFYRRAAESSGAKEAKDLLLRLASDEDDHQQTFAGLHEALVEADAAIDTYDADDIVAQYLRVIAGQYVFAAEQDELTGNESIEDILETAITKEKDSIVLYLGLRDAMADEQGKKVGRILREEQAHLVDLASQLEEWRTGT